MLNKNAHHVIQIFIDKKRKKMKQYIILLVYHIEFKWNTLTFVGAMWQNLKSSKCEYLRGTLIKCVKFPVKESFRFSV